MSMKPHLQEDVEACKEAKSFVDLFYDAMDRRRDKVGFLYSENGPSMVWNGNALQNADDIQKFLLALPSTRHVTHSMDAQVIANPVEGASKEIVVQVAGSVTMSGAVHVYMQTFTLVSEEGKYKIQSDRMRYLD